MKEILLDPNPILRKIAEEVKKVDEGLKEEVKELAEVLESSSNGAGLAAPQIGISKRFFGLKADKSKKVQILINPKIIGVYGKKDWIMIKGENKNGEATKDENFLEGCLSFPNLFGTVKRWIKIRAAWKELEDGKLVAYEKDIAGFEAVVFQHEYDHLDGILFVDHIKNDGGKLFQQEGEKMVEIGVKDL